MLGSLTGLPGGETRLSAHPTISPVSSSPGSGQPASTTLSGDLPHNDDDHVANNSGNRYHLISNRAQDKPLRLSPCGHSQANKRIQV